MPECSKFNKSKWILLPRISLFLILQIIFLNIHLVKSSSHYLTNSSSSSMIRSKRSLNNIFVDLESDQSIYHHSSVYIKKELGQSDYWASIKRKWQQSDLCPCQCIFDQLNRKVIKCDEQFKNVTSMPSIFDPNVEVSFDLNYLL